MCQNCTMPICSTCSKAQCAGDQLNSVLLDFYLQLVLGITYFFLQTFVGNTDRDSAVKHVLYGVLIRYLRFLPKTHQTRVCMRTEVFGVKTKPGDDNYVLKHN